MGGFEGGLGGLVGYWLAIGGTSILKVGGGVPTGVEDGWERWYGTFSLYHSATPTTL